MSKLIIPMDTVGEVSDGYHTFNELYEHRNMLFAVMLAFNKDRSFKSRMHSDGTSYEGWFIAGMDTKWGQITYHMPNDMWHIVEAKELDKAPEWDGHTPNDVLGRIRRSLRYGV